MLRSSGLVGFGGRQWQPEALFKPGDDGLFWDFVDPGGLRQNTDGTGEVTAADQSVGWVRDKSGHGYHGTAAATGERGVWKSDGRVLLDGVDDRIRISTGPAHTAAQTMAWCGYIGGTLVNGGRIFGRASARSVQWLTTPIMRYANNQAGAAVNVTGVTDATVRRVVVVRAQDASTAHVRVNGTQIVSFDPNDDTSTGFALGLPASTSVQPQSCFAALLINRYLTDSETAWLEKIFAAKCGAVLA